jgi:two-component system chemotaxis response regulator CheB
MMRRTRVLIVDDSVTIRKLLSDLIAAQPDLEVASVAANGRIALAKIVQTNPDIVTLDVEMPELDGLETLAEIRKTHPRLPVIMFSSLTERAASATLEALSLGANDYVTKPAGSSGIAGAMDRVRMDLLPKLRHFGVPKPTTPTAAGAPVLPASRTRSMSPPDRRAPIDVVAIGCSTGGPNALSEIFRDLPGNLSVPLVITQHMPRVFTKLLADRLTAGSKVPVHEARDGDVLVAGQAWLAPGDYHLMLERQGGRVHVRLNQGPPENSCRPAVDVMLRSVAAVYGSRSLNVILTGMGQDGLLGCQTLHDLGAHILVQDEGSSVVWGMPGLVAKAGIAGAVLPLAQVSDEIVQRVSGRVTPGVAKLVRTP